jgi:SAM-dependent methyltransferase
VTSVIEAERSKYEEVWSLEEYHRYSPGNENVKRFVSELKPRKKSTIVDIGCGAGGAGLLFRDKYKLDVTWMDLTETALLREVDRSRFRRGVLWQKWGRVEEFNYGFCCDVLEHIPTEFTMLSIHRIVDCCEVSWLQVCNQPDQFGAMIGKPLHLTVEPFTWWLDRIRDIGDVVDARDLCGISLFVVVRR